jgi:SAM-dependent methyltransferase
MPELNAAKHPSRRLLKRILADPQDDEAWTELAAGYSAMADIWTRWATDEADPHDYLAPVVAGLAHLGPVPSFRLDQRRRKPALTRLPWCVEVSCGTGQATSLLTQRCERVVATDINELMIQGAPRLPRVHWLQADVRRMPFADWSVPLLVGLNAVPHIEEFERVLAADGHILWCTSFGAGTPLYVEPAELLEAMADEWIADIGSAANGDWMLMRRVAAHVHV